MKGQGSTEYLVLLAMILVIAMVCLALLGFFPGLAGAGETDEQFDKRLNQEYNERITKINQEVNLCKDILQEMKNTKKDNFCLEKCGCEVINRTLHYYIYKSELYKNFGKNYTINIHAVGSPYSLEKYNYGSYYYCVGLDARSSCHRKIIEFEKDLAVCNAEIDSNLSCSLGCGCKKTDEILYIYTDIYPKTTDSIVLDLINGSDSS